MNNTNHLNRAANAHDTLLKPSSRFRQSIFATRRVLLLFAIFFSCCIVFITLGLSLLYYTLVIPLYQVLVAFIPWSIVFIMLIFLFTKALFTIFKLLQSKPLFFDPTNIRITEKTQPEIFALIHEICEKIQAPLPNKVYLNASADAYIFYGKAPGIFKNKLPQKNLVIGLGLINALTVSQFKAVLAHEMTHLKQNSTALGWYTAAVKETMEEIFDHIKTLEMKAQNTRLSILKVEMQFFRVLRKFLRYWYRKIHQRHIDLNRAMELNADMHAVVISGSNQIIAALFYINKYQKVLNYTISQLLKATEFKLFTTDIFYHQKRFAKKLKDASNQSDISDSEENMGTLFALDQSNHDLYPPFEERVRQANDHFIEGEQDHSPAWSLFRNRKSLKERTTKKMYQSNGYFPESSRYREAEAIHEKIEYCIDTLDLRDKCRLIYHDRVVNPFPLHDAERNAIHAFPTTTSIQQAYAQIFDGELIDKIENLKAIQKRINLYTCANVADGSSSIMDAVFDLKTWNDIQRNAIAEKNELNNQYFKAFDQQLFLLYVAMSLNQARTNTDLYFQYCDFINELVALKRNLERIQLDLDTLNIEVQGFQKKITGENYERYMTRWETCLESFHQAIAQTDEVQIPLLDNIAKGKLSEYFLSNKTWPKKPKVRVVIQEMGKVIAEANKKWCYIYSQSWDKILLIQEDIYQRFQQS